MLLFPLWKMVCQKFQVNFSINNNALNILGRHKLKINKRLWIIQNTVQSFLLIFHAALNFFAIHVVMIAVHLGLVTVTLLLFWINNPNLTSLSKYMYYYRSVWWVTNYCPTLNLSQVTQHLYTFCFVPFKIKAQFGFPMERCQVCAECRKQ